MNKKCPESNLLYICGNYTLGGKATTEQKKLNYQAHLRASRSALTFGWAPLSPILLTVPLEQGQQDDFHYWSEYDYSLLRHCAALWLFTGLGSVVPGSGSAHEMDRAREWGIPVFFRLVPPDGVERMIVYEQFEREAHQSLRIAGPAEPDAGGPANLHCTGVPRPREGDTSNPGGSTGPFCGCSIPFPVDEFTHDNPLGVRKCTTCRWPIR